MVPQVPPQPTPGLEADAHEWLRLLTRAAERIEDAIARKDLSVCTGGRAIATLAGAVSKIMPRAQLEARLAEVEALLASTRRRERLGSG
jgi:hypothetical protein